MFEVGTGAGDDAAIEVVKALRSILVSSRMEKMPMQMPNGFEWAGGVCGGGFSPGAGVHHAAEETGWSEGGSGLLQGKGGADMVVKYLADAVGDVGIVHLLSEKRDTMLPTK
ncbi:MAG: hypothetical protein IKK45_07035 [Akkermansia sp.]|nr:hypothetical protein [Akkermansia sp.]